MYQYDPETRAFKLRRSRRPWTDESSSGVAQEPDGAGEDVALPESPPADAFAPQATEPDAPLPGSNADATGVPVSPGAQRVKRRRRAPSPYLPQEPEPGSQNSLRRLIWVLIFLMLVAWVLMMSPLINRIQSNEMPIFRQDTDQTPFPKL